jgi:glycosyltransferase involved in cell wall biosynthesis
MSALQPGASRPDVAVVMPCYNGERFLREAIDSVLGQSYASRELIVVDDGSVDASPEILRGYGDAIRVIRQANQGRPRARNAGLAAAAAPYVAFLDCDDYWAPTFLERMVEAIDREGADIAYCGWQNIGVPGGRGEPFVPPDYQAMPNKAELLFENTRWPIHAALARRERIARAGGFDPRWSACQDFALWLETGWSARLARVPEVLAYYRHHGAGQITARKAVVAEFHWRVQQDFLARHPDLRRAWGRKRVRRLSHGELLRRGYDCYWRRDLEAARRIFRLVMRTGYGGLRDWRYMLPSLLPLAWHRRLVSLADRREVLS